MVDFLRMKSGSQSDLAWASRLAVEEDEGDSLLRQFSPLAGLILVVSDELN